MVRGSAAKPVFLRCPPLPRRAKSNPLGACASQESSSAWKHIVHLLTNAGAKPIVDSIFPFAELQQTFARLGQGPMGKVLQKGMIGSRAQGDVAFTVPLFDKFMLRAIPNLD